MYIDNTQERLRALQRRISSVREATGVDKDREHIGAEHSEENVAREEDRKYNMIMNTIYGSDGKIQDANDNTIDKTIDVTG